LIFIAGGCSGNQTYHGEFSTCSAISSNFYSFSRSTQKYSQLPNLPIPRYRHTSAIVGSKVYFIGGLDDSDSFITQVDIFDAGLKKSFASFFSHFFSLESQMWEIGPSIPSPRTDLSSFVIESSPGKIWVVGGYNEHFLSQNTTLVLDTNLAPFDWNESGEMNYHRGDLCASGVSGRGYVYGGFQHDNYCFPISNLESFGEKEGWRMEAVDPFGLQRGDKGCAGLEGRFFVLGGEIKDDPVDCFLSIPVDNVDIYDVEKVRKADRFFLI